MRKVLLLFLMVLSVNYSLTAQKAIEDAIAESEILFKEGNVAKSLDTLKSLENTPALTKAQKIRIFRQMTIGYIFLNQEDSTDMATNMKMAKQSYLKLLQVNNIYRPNPDDIIDYRRFAEKFESKPFISINPKFGLNTSFVDVLQYYGSSNLSDAGYYNLGSASPYKLTYTNLTAGFSAEWNFYHRFNLVLGGYYTQRSYDYSENMVFGKTPFTLSFTEKQNWIDLTSAIKFDIGYFKDQKLVPYIYGGTSYHFLSNSKLQGVKRSFAELTEVTKLTDSRIPYNWSLIGGAGLKMRVFGKHFFTIEGQYGRMIRAINDIDHRYTSVDAKELNYNVGYVDNDIRFNNFSFTVGFSYAFYNLKMTKE
jgi:hypothetical protein